MPTAVRSYSKINLGLAIGPPRPDGFHALLTLYQTLALHDLVTVTVRQAAQPKIVIIADHPGVPTDARNTAWKIVEGAFSLLPRPVQVTIEIQKKLPVQGGLGAGSANAAAALLGLERELGLAFSATERLQLAARVGSDVPLFLLGGAVLGSDRGQAVQAVGDLTLGKSTCVHCVVALPAVGVSTPQAFRDWDRLSRHRAEENLHDSPNSATLEKLSRTYAQVFPQERTRTESGTSGIFQDSRPAMDGPENLHGRSAEQLQPTHKALAVSVDESGIENDLAENTLLALVRTGIENDFESVVFLQYPFLREIKRQLMGFEAESTAVFAGLSGSGSALFGLYRTKADAQAAQHRLQQQGVRSVLTQTIPRTRYWSEMFAE